MTPQEIVRFVETRRWPLSDEKRLQADMGAELSKAGIAHRREVVLAPGDIVDFMVGDIAVEVKIKGARREIYRQCERYCQHETVRSLVLATNVAMGMPAFISGRPILVAHLSRGWL